MLSGMTWHVYIFRGTACSFLVERLLIVRGGGGGGGGGVGGRHRKDSSWIG